MDGIPTRHTLMTCPEGSELLGPVSPSLLSRLNCPLRISFEQQSRGARSSHGAAAILGTVAHETIRLVLAGNLLTNAWVQACQLEANRTRSDPASFPAARRTFLRLQNHVPVLMEFIKSRPEATIVSETPMESPDGAIAGIPDLVLLTDGEASAIVIDYKTGLVSDELGINSTYANQLLLYGALVTECLDAKTVELALFSLREGLVRIETGGDLIAASAAHARATRDSFNARVPGPQPANPTPDNCKWCPYAPRCEAFWNSFGPEWIQAVGVAVKGIVQSEPEHSASGTTTVKLSVTNGPSDTSIVSGIPTEYVSRAVIGTEVRALDLNAKSNDPLILSWTNRANLLRRIVVS